MTETVAEARTIDRRILRLLATDGRFPPVVRALAQRVGSSSLASRLAHGVFWSMAGTAAARALALAASIVTARLLGKAEYGELGVLNSTLLTLQAFAGLGLGLTATKYVAELRAVDPERAGRILGMSTMVSAGAGLAATALMWIFAPWLAARTLGAPHLAPLLRIAACGLVFTTLGGAQTGALAGFEAFRLSTWLNVGAGLLGVPIVLAGTWAWGIRGAVWATVATGALQWAATHVALRGLARRHGIPLRLHSFGREWRVLWNFSLPALAQGVLVAPVNWAAAAILVNREGGFLEMGVLTAANQWYGAAMFLPNALGGAVLPVLAERIGRGDADGARRVLAGAIALSAGLVLPVAIVAGVASPTIMSWYGAQFSSGWPTLLLVLATAAVVALTNPVGNVLAASGRLWVAVLMNSGWAAVLLAATVALVPWGASGVAGARLIAYAVHTVWTIWFGLRLLRHASAR